jgi:integrase
MSCPPGVHRVHHMTTVHDARRTCATLLVDVDVHPRVIMRIRRSADVSMTLEIYSDASPMATREAQSRPGGAPSSAPSSPFLRG